MITRLAALAAALMVTGAAAPALAQSYEETVNFIVTGNVKTSEVSFGNQMTVASTNRITGYDANQCTFDIETTSDGLLAGLSMLFLGPELGKRPDAAVQPPPPAPDTATPILATSTRIHLNAVSGWEVLPLTSQYGLHGYQLSLNGTGDTINSGTVTISGKRAVVVDCKDKCGFNFPPDTDLDRFKKAMDYLFSQYCAGSYSAF